MAASPVGADDHTATIEAKGFIPIVITIPNGDRVAWKNNDTKARQIVADDGSFRSGRLIPPGGRYARVFPLAGRYVYHDGTRPAERGAVQVNEARTVTLERGAVAILFNRAVKLSGTIESTARDNVNNQRVTIFARPFGSESFTPVTTTVTTQGRWEVLVRPHRNTAYHAVWKNVPSENRTVFVKPLLRLKQLGRRLFTLGVSADANLRFHRALIQRWVAKRHAWKRIAVVRLRYMRATQSAIVVTARFRLTVPRGVIIRGLMTRAQAGPAQYGPSASRPIRI